MGIHELPVGMSASRCEQTTGTQPRPSPPALMRVCWGQGEGPSAQMHACSCPLSFSGVLFVMGL